MCYFIIIRIIYITWTITQPCYNELDTYTYYVHFHIPLYTSCSSDLQVYRLYMNSDEKPVIDENKFQYTSEMTTQHWTPEDGYKLLIKATDFQHTGKIWIGLLPLLGKFEDLMFTLRYV